jgi:hypothetical protein
MKPAAVISVRLLALAAGCLAAAAAGCGGKTAGLGKQVHEMEARIKAADCAGLYGLLSKEKKGAMTQEQFVELCKQEAAELKRLAQTIVSTKKAKQKASVAYKAVVTLKDGSTLQMVYENGAWKIDSALIDFYPNTTPGEALASFIKAFEAKRWDVLARLMPSQYTSKDDAKILEEQWSSPAAHDEMEQLLTVLKDHLQDEVTIDGNRATLAFAPSHLAELLKERGAWMIVKIY